MQAARFTLIGGHLYKRSFTSPYLWCLNHAETLYVLAELHEGVCGNHSGGRSLAHRAHSQGYYWPTMKKDAAADQNFSIVPKYLAFLRSNSGQEKLEKESLRLL